MNELINTMKRAYPDLIPRTNLKKGRVLFENRPALYFCNYKKN